MFTRALGGLTLYADNRWFSRKIVGNVLGGRVRSLLAMYWLLEMFENHTL